MTTNRRPILSKSQTYLITGGAGSLGKALINRIALTGNTIRILDINESSLSDIISNNQKVRCLYGDICDANRVDMAMNGVDVVIHCAAMKNINVSEYNIPELIRTNIIGTQNVILSAIKNRVKHVVFISTDKSVKPTTCYGTTKLVGEYLTKWASSIDNNIIYTIIRPCNFLESSGNVFEVWKKQHESFKPLTLTHENMYRYFIDIEIVANCIYRITQIDKRDRFKNTIIIPWGHKISILDIMKQKYPQDKYVVTGIRYGEKLEEELWNDDEHPVEFKTHRRVLWY